MPPGAKKRKQQRKEEAAKARQDEAHAAETGDVERTPPTEADEMAIAPLTGIHSLPYETLSAIFSFLPIPDLARCATVCKQWHEIVTGYTGLWKGKRYRSYRSPRQSAEVYAVLCALPPIEEVVVEADRFCIDVSYPRLLLNMRDVADLPPRTRASRSCSPRFWELEHLRFLRHCPHVRRLCLCDWVNTSQLSDLRHLARLEVLDIRHCRVDADLLSSVLPSLTRLHTLSLFRSDVAHLRFLRHCPQLRTLSLYDTTELKKEAYRELRHVTNLQTLRVRDFVREVVRPWLPKVQIYCSEYYIGPRYKD